MILKTVDETIVKSGIGVVVGRFQVAALTEGHISLLNSVQERHEKLIIVVGLAPIKATKNNPLDFETRRRMLAAAYPQAAILYLEDHPDDAVWSRTLNRNIENSVPPQSAVVLYGSRDSFQSHYTGKYLTKELLQESFTSGTKERERLSFLTQDNEAFRQGVIWATQQRFPTAYQAVDAAIIDVTTRRLLMGKKKIDGDRWRFVGGFVEPHKGKAGEDYLEQTVKREVVEETGLEVGEPTYVCSMVIDDWRYRGEVDSITTVLFECPFVFGRPEPADDIDELKWFDVKTIEDQLDNLIVVGHQPLMRKYLKYREVNKRKVSKNLHI